MVFYRNRPRLAIRYILVHLGLRKQHVLTYCKCEKINNEVSLQTANLNKITDKIRTLSAYIPAQEKLLKTHVKNLHKTHPPCCFTKLIKCQLTINAGYSGHSTTASSIETVGFLIMRKRLLELRSYVITANATISVIHMKQCSEAFPGGPS